MLKISDWASSLRNSSQTYFRFAPVSALAINTTKIRHKKQTAKQLTKL